MVKNAPDTFNTPENQVLTLIDFIMIFLSVPNDQRDPCFTPRPRGAFCSSRRDCKTCLLLECDHPFQKLHGFALVNR